ncbi:MAG: serine/threonine-protein kinase [Polyangiales bacterium]
MIDTGQPRPFGPYVLLRRLAAGGMAEVYLAKAQGGAGFEKPVAVKRIHAQSLAGEANQEMLIEEAKLSVSLCHPNIVQTFDLSFVEGSFVLVMEHVEGCDLQRVIELLRKADRSFPVDLAVYVLAEVCRALDYAHRMLDAKGAPAGIVHRDVSPQNILLSRAGEVKIADFGIAKTTVRRSDPDAQVLKGKYFYMSPEQASAEPLDHRSDIFSAGIVLWELLVGRRLYQEGDVGSLLHAVRRARVPPPSTLRDGVPFEIDAIIAGATARDPGKRYPDAAAMAHALERCLTRRSSAHAARRIDELLAGLPYQEPAKVGSDEMDLPQTRDRLMTLPLSERPTPPDPPLRFDLENGEPTVAGLPSPKVTPQRVEWAIMLGAAFGVAAWLLWWLHGA